MIDYRRVAPADDDSRATRVRLSRRRLYAAVSVTALVLGVAAGQLSSAARSAASVQVFDIPTSGAITVQGHGNGHGHGMSQYGAEGAALAGLSAAQIMAFYYPGTTLATMSPNTTMRVLISDATTDTCVLAKAGLTATGVSGTLSTTGVSRFRLVASGSGLALQRSAGSNCGGSAWQNVATNLPATANIASTQGYVRLFLNDGTSTDYRGTVGAVRSGSGEITVNRLGLDGYTMGVTPRESPSSWAAAAVQAQAIAARSYGEYSREHAGSAPYDICDTDQCQVYGGMTHYSAGGAVLWTDDPAAVTGDAGQVVQYRGATAFTQFSASDGGWTVAGGQPYLVAKADPYDDAASGDPYLNWSSTVTPSQIASYFGLSSVSQIQVVQRDGHGQWGGRVLQAIVVGKAGNTPAQIPTTGFSLAAAMGVMQNWFELPEQAPAGSGGTVVAVSPSTVDTFFVSSSGDLLQSQDVSGAGWITPVDLGRPANGLVWDPDAAARGGGQFDVVARDSRGHLVIRAYSPTSGWGIWHVYPQLMVSSPAVTDPSPAMRDVFYRGPDNTLWTVQWTATGGWAAAYAVPGVTNVDSGPDATWTGQRLAIVYRGTNGLLWTVTSKPGGWSAPLPVNPTHAMPAPPLRADPSVGSDGSGMIAVYYTGADDVIYSASVTGGQWGTWYSVTGSNGTSSAPDVTYLAPGNAMVVSGRSGVIGTASWSATAGWHGWQALP